MRGDRRYRRPPSGRVTPPEPEPVADDRVVELTRLHYRFEADVLAARLAAEGISTTVTGEEIPGGTPAGDGCRILVRSSQLDDARRVLDDLAPGSR